MLVGESTKRATDAAIVYEDAGTHALKEEGAAPALADDPRRRRPRRRRPGSRPRGAVRGTRPRAPPRQGALPRHGGRGPRAPAARRRGGHRQVAPRLGVPEVRRRAGHRCVVAPRPLPGVRGRRRLGPREMVRTAGIAEDETEGEALGKLHRSRGVRPGSRRARAGRAAPAAPARADRADVGRPGGSLLGVAPVLRADERPRPGGADLRGPALGRYRAGRLRPSPARMVTSVADLRHRPREARACTAARGLRERRTEHHVARAGGAVRRAGRRAPPGACSGPPGRGSRPSPRASRGYPALRRRDGADAHRPRAPGAGRNRLPRQR